MPTTAVALLLMILAMGNAWAGCAPCRNCGDASPRITNRRGPIPLDVQGRPAVPIEMERHPMDVEVARPPVLPMAPTPPTATHPSPVTACDPGGCWDTSGARYNGTGPAMIRGDGKVCQQIGNMMHCK